MKKLKKDPCPDGPINIRLHDEPNDFFRRTNTIPGKVRWLFFDVTVSSAPNCPCKYESMNFTAVQYLGKDKNNNTIHYFDDAVPISRTRTGEGPLDSEGITMR